MFRKSKGENMPINLNKAWHPPDTLEYNPQNRGTISMMHRKHKIYGSSLWRFALLKALSWASSEVYVWLGLWVIAVGFRGLKWFML